MMRRCVVIAVTGLLLSICGCSCGEDYPKAVDALNTMASGDRFLSAHGSVIPRPSEAPPTLLVFADRSYDTSVAVRRILARYFLRYDALLLQRGILDSDHGPGDLISLLWAKESTRNSRLSESGSITAMRQHMEANQPWFGLGPEEADMIDRNKQLLNHYVQFATSRRDLERPPR